MNKFLRIIAALRNSGSKDLNYKIVLLLGTDKDSKVLPGHWMGYVRNLNVVHPFLFDTEKRTFLYGGEEHSKERTSLSHQTIVQGNMFSLSADFDGSADESTYEIIAVHRYDDDEAIESERKSIQGDDA